MLLSALFLFFFFNLLLRAARNALSLFNKLASKGAVTWGWVAGSRTRPLGIVHGTGGPRMGEEEGPEL